MLCLLLRLRPAGRALRAQQGHLVVVAHLGAAVEIENEPRLLAGGEVGRVEAVRHVDTGLRVVIGQLFKLVRDGVHFPVAFPRRVPCGQDRAGAAAQRLYLPHGERERAAPGAVRSGDGRQCVRRGLVRVQLNDGVVSAAAVAARGL